LNNFLKYKGYIGSVNYSDENQTFWGKLEGIRDLVTYEATDVHSLKREFQTSVDDYLSLCQSQDKPAEKPFKGSFNVRTGSKLHRQAVLYAKTHNQSLNKTVKEALEKYLPKEE